MTNINRKKIIAGNWKMNNTRKDTVNLLSEVAPKVVGAKCEVIICVPFTNLETAVRLTSGTNIKVGAQNCHFADNGAYTGEISAQMLTEIGATYVIIGHSERRQYFAETDQSVNLKIKKALENGLKAILCVGETLEQREENITEEIIGIQVIEALKGLKKQDMKDIILAYEPIWAIGTGKTATSEQAQEVCAYIRKIIKNTFNEDIAQNTSILYGGSMKPQNAAELLEKEDVDGGLIGGASLKSEDFSQLVKFASI